ncbi:MAG: hypothetical protein M3071_06505 [Actinomycetota bacterium]|nr:hypothetical protein [Actinomycetota bacterium]
MATSMVDVDESNADFGTHLFCAYRRERTRNRAKTTVTAAPPPRIVNKSRRSANLYESRNH